MRCATRLGRGGAREQASWALEGVYRRDIGWASMVPALPTAPKVQVAPEHNSQVLQESALDLSWLRLSAFALQILCTGACTRTPETACWVRHLLGL